MGYLPLFVKIYLEQVVFRSTFAFKFYKYALPSITQVGASPQTLMHQTVDNPQTYHPDRTFASKVTAPQQLTWDSASHTDRHPKPTSIPTTTCFRQKLP